MKVSFFYSRRNQCRTYFTCSGLCGFCPDDSEQELSPLRKESKDVRFDFIYCCIVLHRTVVHTPVLWLSPFPDLSFRRFWRLGHGISLPSSFDVSWLPAPSSPPYGIWADGTRPPVVTGCNYSWNSSIYYKNRWTMKRFSGSFYFWITVSIQNTTLLHRIICILKKLFDPFPKFIFPLNIFV